MYEIIKDFRMLSAPPAEAIAKREEQIKEMIEKLGHKYRLSKPMPKIKQGK